jgi:hypothetical protein
MRLIEFDLADWFANVPNQYVEDTGNAIALSGDGSMKTLWFYVVARCQKTPKVKKQIMYTNCHHSSAFYGTIPLNELVPNALCEPVI